MKLIITRHGETEENNTGIIQGHQPGHLSEQGVKQARKVAIRLKDESIDCIYSSDLNRAADTAREIAQYHPDVPLEFVKELRERYLGGWQGKTRKELGFGSDINLMGFFPKDGETSEELFNRASNFLDTIFSNHHDKTVLSVAHNGINKALIAVITGKGSTDIKSIEHLHHTSVSVFEIKKDKSCSIHIFNCTKHLE